MDFKDIKNIKDKAIELQSEGKTIDQINEIIGIDIDPELLTSWWIDKNGQQYKSVIFKLYKMQKMEKNFEKKQKLLYELKEKLEDILKIIPNDIDMQTKLMYTYIYLKQLDEARTLGYNLLKQSQSQEILSGLSILEERSGNYKKSIEFIDKILEANPNNEFYQNKRKTLLNKGKTSKLNKKYAKIATLERSINKLIEQKEDELRLQGQSVNHDQIYTEMYEKIYGQIKEIAESILEKQPYETIAREKLVKSLYLTNNPDLAKITGSKFLKENPNDEIILWYMCRISRDSDNLEDEKHYLEQLININPDNASLKNIMRLDKVNSLLEKQKRREEEKNMPINFTEEDRKAWIEHLEHNFKYGNISLADIDKKIEEAKTYPNYIKSLISLLDIKAMITEDYQGELDELNAYLENEFSISKEDYKDILDAMDNIKSQIDYKKISDSYNYDDER